MKYQLIHKYCPVTASKKGWEQVIGIYDTKTNAEQTVKVMMKSRKNLEPYEAALVRAFTSRMLFVIREIGDENGNNC